MNENTSNPCSNDQKESVQIPLQGGGRAIIDPDVYEQLGLHAWRKSSHGYAYRTSEQHGRSAKVYMHREIMGNPALHVDHINGDRLDNRRANLRLVTAQENQFNARKITPGTSHYKGVSYQGGKWVARITLDRKTRYLGSYGREVDAARAYDEAARRLFGEFAMTNLN